MIIYVTDERSVAFLALRVNEIISTSQGTSGSLKLVGRRQKGKEERSVSPGVAGGDRWGVQRGRSGASEGLP